MVAVAFFIFNRPDLTKRSFASIRERRPERLLIVADGPRSGTPGDLELCARAREVVEEIDWKCQVTREYSDVNLGLKGRMVSGLQRVFSDTESAIVVEDDCVPHSEFFSFCETLLEVYRDDNRVMSITGDNFQRGRWRGNGAYYFSKYVHIWGWASWSRAWANYDPEISFWPEFEQSPQWRELMPLAAERRYWSKIMSRVQSGAISTWDYQWAASVWRRGGLTATPNLNLVHNIGFGEGATNTRSDRVAPLSEGGLGELDGPIDVVPCRAADRYTFMTHYGGSPLGRMTAEIQRLRGRRGGGPSLANSRF